MKTICTLAAIATFAFASAQKSDLNKLNVLAVTGPINITLVKASASSVEVTKGKADNLKIATDGNAAALSVVRQDEELSATVYYTDGLTAISLGSGAQVSSKDAITLNEFAISLAAGTKATLNVAVETLQTAAAAGSQVTVKGKASTIQASIAAGALFDAQKAEAETVEIVVATGAKAMVNATDTVSASVASKGEVTIYGNPKQVNESKAGDGIVKRAK